jgi:P pilus assembly chaperone PapD
MELRRGRLHTGAVFHPDRALTHAALVLIAALPAQPAIAQVSVEVSPLRVELQAAPGGTTTQAITLNNSGKEPIRVRARVTDWDLTRDGSPQFEGVAEGGPYSATAWLRIAPPEQILETAKEAIVRFSLSVPADAAAAGYRTGILFEFLPATEDPVGRAREVQVRSRIATLIYVNIGQAPIAVELTDLRIRPSPTETQVIATLNNTSKRHVRTKGTLTVYDPAGKAVREAPVPDVPLLPEREREVAITAYDASTPLPAGDYRVEVRIDVGMPAVIVGETTIKVSK